MNHAKYFQDLLHYQYVQGEFEALDDLLLIAA
jgi:hypothetical protein